MEKVVSQQGLHPKNPRCWWSQSIQPTPALFVEIVRTVPISAYFDEGFCVVNICPLASGQGPSPFHKKRQTAVRWSWLWVNTKWTATGDSLSSYYPSLGDTQSPSSYLLAHSLTPDQQLPYFCESDSAHSSKQLEWIKPELTLACLRVNDQFGPCFSSSITQLFCLLTYLNAAGMKARSESRFTFQSLHFAG